jgi:hypothetical protein
MARIRTAHALIAASALVLAACADQAPTDPQLRAEAPQAAIDPASLARSVPGFGGLYVENGTPVVYLTDVGRRAEAEQALRGWMQSRGSTRIDVRRADFSWTELDRYHRAVTTGALEHAGVVFTDLDERNNRVTIGVTNGTGALAARAVAERLGVPAHAVRIQQTDPIYPMVGLRDLVRPVQSGLQINHGNYVCTLGFNATHSTGASYVTNSHCTNTQGGTEGTIHYQPAFNVAGAQIGTEAADPAYAKGGSCTKGKKCRYSDSSRGLYAAGVPFVLGQIARTTSRGSLTGSLTIDATNPFFTITAEDGQQVVGEQINKVGRTSGWTFGNVTNTCVNTSVSGSQIMLYCQTFAAAGVQGGDSGSAIFQWSGSGSNVTLAGLLWGGNSAGNSLVYSPIHQVEQELGALTTF